MAGARCLPKMIELRTITAMAPDRSTDPDDYQALPRPIGAMAKHFPAGFRIEPHSHRRDQLVYAVNGTMRVHTRAEAWIVPPDRAVYLPAGVEHAIDMGAAVEMRTVYIQAGADHALPTRPVVIAVAPLLRALILALIEEPILYDEAGRGGAIVRLILSEIARAPALPLSVPMPNDARLRRLCAALLADPADPRGLEDWAAWSGASPRTLARLFARELGQSFAVWRQRVRFHNALEALVRGEPVGRVAAANGYRGASAFTAAFRKVMGLAPSAVARTVQP
jgi:AraC-like DNA-binding protein/mannose-6-phosphate isomerase-like protein (cupin superfamily)